MSMENETVNLTERDETNFFVRVIKNFIPWKGDDRSDVIRKFIFLCSVVLFVYSVGELKDFLKADEKDRSYVQQIANDYEPDNVDLGKTSGDGKDVSAPGADNDRKLRDWAKKLLKRNGDVKGWIKIPGFNNSEGEEYINFPVLQGEDNNYYLYKNLDKEYYESGSIFVDAWAEISEKRQSDNLTIYGHNMRYVGTSFTHLTEYKQGVKFLKKHPVIEFNSIYESGSQYIIVGMFVANLYDYQDDGNVFLYNAYRDFDKKEYSFDGWLKEVKKRSWITGDVKCTANDKYITLSTCTNECADMRWVIVAKKLTAEDNADSLVKSYKDKQDKDIYFPACWVNIYGNGKRYFGWDY